MTKTFLAAVTFVVALASPVFAQSFDPDLGSGNIVSPPAAYTPGYSGAARVPRFTGPALVDSLGAYAQEPAWNGLPEGPIAPSQSAPRRTKVRR
jgi:hypothetical protein